MSREAHWERVKAIQAAAGIHDGPVTHLWRKTLPNVLRAKFSAIIADLKQKGLWDTITSTVTSTYQTLTPANLVGDTQLNRHLYCRMNGCAINVQGLASFKCTITLH